MTAQFRFAELIHKLTKIIGPEAVITDTEERRYYSQDAFWQDATSAVVVHPNSKTHVQEVVSTATQLGFAVIPRGGGMSYTRGYVPVSDDTVIIDMRGLNSIVEINEEDMYVTAEAGCTWQQLYETLRERGLRTPYFGPMSGMFATVGGALSQNSMFYGSATYGTVAESVLGVEVVLADGSLVATGSKANRGNKPFFRHYGPDLTGLFLSDTGALGFKVKATLRLIRSPSETEFASFAFNTFEDMVHAQAEVARLSLAAECFGLDPYLNGKRTLVKDLKTGIDTLKNVAKAGKSVVKGVKSALDVATAGTGFLDDVTYSLHTTTDASHRADAKWKIDEIRRVCTERGREIEPTIPKVARATPFKHVGEFLVGHKGERWIPIHACVPYSKAMPVYEATMNYFESKREVLEKYDISTSHLTGSSGMDLIFEPAFYYPDSLEPFHLRNLEQNDAQKYMTLPAVPGATDAVKEMLHDLANLFMEHGAVHQQLGKFYPFSKSLDASTWKLLSGVKRLVDPSCKVNPTALGFT